MRTFEQLSTEQREQAIKTALYALIDNLANDVLEIELISPEANECLQRALAKNRVFGNTRPFTLFVLSNKPVRYELEKLALVVASESTYNKDGSPIMSDNRKLQ